MLWTPDSWEEFRRTYRAGNCHVDFFHNTLDWASRNGWKLEPDLRQKRIDALKAFLALSSMLIVVSLLDIWSFWVPVVGVPIAALVSYGMATTPGQQAFVQRLLASEQDFWDAWRGSGIDLYRRGADGKYPFERRDSA